MLIPTWWGCEGYREVLTAFPTPQKTVVKMLSTGEPQKKEKVIVVKISLCLLVFIFDF